jgi:hypothetical protein
LFYYDKSDLMAIRIDEMTMRKVLTQGNDYPGHSI